MMEHEETRKQLYAFLDGELTPAQRLTFARHLVSCSSCRQRLEYEAAIKTLVWEKAGRKVAPPGLRERIIAEIERVETRPSLWQWLNIPLSVRPLVGLALAISLLIIAFIPTFLRYGGMGGDSVPPIFRELTSKHVVFATERDALEVVGGEAEIAQWYQGKGNLILVVPQSAGLELLGGRLSDLHHERALHLIYESADRYVSFFVFKSLEEDFPASLKQVYVGEEFYIGSWEGRSLVLWRRRETGYALVADLEREKLLEMAYEMRVKIGEKNSH